MSNTQQIKESLQSLLTDENPFVAMLSGAWGIGKTYFWKELVKENERVAYISLFGHNSLDDIKTDIMTEVGMIQHDKFKEFTERTKDLQILGVGVGGLFSMFTKEDYAWAEEYINELYTTFEGEDLLIEEVKSIMHQFIIDESHSLLDNTAKLNSLAKEKYRSFIQDDTEFIELLIKFLSKRPELSHDFKVDKAIESIKKALLELKEKSDVYARKVDYIAEEAKITLDSGV